jgi:hypothetical protein
MSEVPLYFPENMKPHSGLHRDLSNDPEVENP